MNTQQFFPGTPEGLKSFFIAYFDLYYKRPGYTLDPDYPEYLSEAIDNTAGLIADIKGLNQITFVPQYLPSGDPKDLMQELSILVSIQTDEEMPWELEEIGIAHNLPANLYKFWELLDLSGGECSPIWDLRESVSGNWYTFFITESY